MLKLSYPNYQVHCRPLRVRQGIRDHWEDGSAPVQVARSAVKQLLGTDVIIVVEWELLVNELDVNKTKAAELLRSHEGKLDATIRAFVTSA